MTGDEQRGYYSCTVGRTERLTSGTYEAVGEVLRQDTHTVVTSVSGWGRTKAEAEENALTHAAQIARLLAPPAD